MPRPGARLRSLPDGRGPRASGRVSHHVRHVGLTSFLFSRPSPTGRGSGGAGNRALIEISIPDPSFSGVIAYRRSAEPATRSAHVRTEILNDHAVYDDVPRIRSCHRSFETATVLNLGFRSCRESPRWQRTQNQIHLARTHRRPRMPLRQRPSFPWMSPRPCPWCATKVNSGRKR